MIAVKVLHSNQAEFMRRVLREIVNSKISTLFLKAERHTTTTNYYYCSAFCLPTMNALVGKIRQRENPKHPPQIPDRL